MTNYILKCTYSRLWIAHIPWKKVTIKYLFTDDNMMRKNYNHQSQKQLQKRIDKRKKNLKA